MFATATSPDTDDTFHMVIEKLPAENGWDWIAWKSGRPKLQKAGIALSLKLATAFTQKAAGELFMRQISEYSTANKKETDIEQSLISDDFRIAAERAREVWGNKIWNQISTREQCEAIYKEIRAMDKERAALPKKETTH